MVTRYIKQGDRISLAAEKKAFEVLQQSSRPEDAAAVLAYLTAKQRIEPLRLALAEKVKSERTIRRERDQLSGELVSAQARISELEGAAADLTRERDGLKDDMARISNELSCVRLEKATLQNEAHNLQRKASTAETDAGKLRNSFRALSEHLKNDDLALRLLIEHGDALAPELFLAVGWNQDQYDKTLLQWRRDRNATSADLIELLHREANCTCVQQGNRQKPDAEYCEYLRATLRHRGVNPEREAFTLVQKHQEEWFRQRRTLFTEPPLSQRQITPIPQIAHWND